MLHFADKTLNQVPFAVQPAVVLAWRFAALVRRNDGNRLSLLDQRHKSLRSVASVSNHMRAVQVFQQAGRLGAVVNLPTRQQQPQGITQPIHRNVDFGRETASTTPQRLFFLPAAFFGHPRHRGALAPSCCPASRSPYRRLVRGVPAFAPIRQLHTSEQTVCTRRSSYHTFQATTAIAHRCALSTTRLPETGGRQLHPPHKRVAHLSRRRVFSSIARRST